MSENPDHPLKDFSINIKGIKCFTREGSGFFSFSPITFVIGRNNTGKSTVIDALQHLTRRHKKHSFGDIQRHGETALFEFLARPMPQQIARHFQDNVSGGGIPGGSHRAYAQNEKLSSREFLWSLDTKTMEFKLDAGKSKDCVPESAAMELLGRCYQNPLTWKWTLRVGAERDVKPELKGQERKLRGNGEGLTNLVRSFITSDDLPRSAVEVDLLEDLNTIYKGDNEFSQIICQENEGTGSWEIYLREDHKGDIRLSQSGSSLKTAFLVLAFLRLVPLIQDDSGLSDLIFCIEEPENNLHPALLRRLIEFLADEREKHGFSLVISTHSPICIDWAAKRRDATILHVRNEDDRTVCRNVTDYGGRSSILDDLDVRGSDILQSNGVIWVEGPSDRTYIRKWIELASQGELREGAHYTFLYYGGKVLSHFEAIAPEDVGEKIQMLLINRNAALVMDSDRRPKAGGGKGKPRMRLNDTKRRLIEEVNAIGGFSWVTAGKEIENYVPNYIWEKVAECDLSITGEYADIPSLPNLKKAARTKVELAHLVEEYLEEGCLNHLDLVEQIGRLCAHIRRWNKL